MQTSTRNTTLLIFFQQSESWVDYSEKYICIWIQNTPQHSNMSTRKVRLNIYYNELHEKAGYSDFGLRSQSRVFRPLNQKVTADFPKWKYFWFTRNNLLFAPFLSSTFRIRKEDQMKTCSSSSTDCSLFCFPEHNWEKRAMTWLEVTENLLLLFQYIFVVGNNYIWKHSGPDPWPL